MPPVRTIKTKSTQCAPCYRYLTKGARTAPRNHTHTDSFFIHSFARFFNLRNTKCRPYEYFPEGEVLTRAYTYKLLFTYFTYHCLYLHNCTPMILEVYCCLLYYYSHKILYTIDTGWMIDDSFDSSTEALNK